jgi:hypothetical protein
MVVGTSKNESAVEIIIPIIVASINAPINGGKKL